MQPQDGLDGNCGTVKPAGRAAGCFLCVLPFLCPKDLEVLCFFVRFPAPKEGS